MQISNKSPRLNLFRTLVFLFAFLSSPYAFAEGKPLPPQCTDLCDVPYGEVLGVTRDGTTSYSNCQADCVVFDPNQEQGTYSGIKWQCVEYARRWLIRNRGITFGDVDVAADMWNLPSFTSVKDKSTIPLQRFVNGAKTLPKRGDLLIYGREYLRTGHAAVVLEVNSRKGYMRVAEQNFLNQKWPGAYARLIPFVWRKGQVWILDGYLLGWLSVEDKSR